MPLTREKDCMAEPSGSAIFIGEGPNGLVIERWVLFQADFRESNGPGPTNGHPFKTFKIIVSWCIFLCKTPLGV